MNRLSTIAGAALLGCLASTFAFADQPVAQAVNLDKSVTYPLANGCSYDASVKGTAKPVKSGEAKAKGSASINPDFTVSAQVTCPNAAKLRVSDNIMKTGPLTMQELEQALERRAAVISDASGRRCVYMPDFTLTKDDLKIPSVSFLCPAT